MSETEKPLWEKIYDKKEIIIIGCFTINLLYNLNKLTRKVKNIELYIKNRYRVHKLN